MAINTVNKRISTINMPISQIMPIANGAIGIDDRSIICFQYIHPGSNDILDLQRAQILNLKTEGLMNSLKSKGIVEVLKEEGQVKSLKEEKIIKVLKEEGHIKTLKNKGIIKWLK